MLRCSFVACDLLEKVVSISISPSVLISTLKNLKFLLLFTATTNYNLDLSSNGYYPRLVHCPIWWNARLVAPSIGGPPTDWRIPRIGVSHGLVLSPRSVDPLSPFVYSVPPVDRSRLVQYSTLPGTMPFRPYHETLDRPSVLPVERYENKWLSRLKKFEENPTFPVQPRLYPIPLLDYEGRRLCGICWEPGHPTEHAVFTFYKACRHVCCYECLLRWLFVSCEKRCPICVANEVSHKLAVKLAWAGLPNVANTPHFSFGSEAGDFLPKEVAGNNRIFFTRSVMDSVEAVGRYVATLNVQVHTSSFYQLGSVSLWCETSDKMVGDMVVEALTLYCPVCFRDFTATRFGVREKNRIDLFHVNGHLKRHKNALCEPCFRGQALFPRDEFVFETEELAEYHKERTHLQCKLCTNPPFFYDKPELVHHCRREHFMCYVCDSSELFFLDASSLYKHIVSRHYACTVCPRNLETVTAFTTVTKLLEHHFDQHANEPIDVERFELLYAVNKNIVFYEDNPFRHKLDLIDGSMRRLFRAGRFHYEVPELKY